MYTGHARRSSFRRALVRRNESTRRARFGFLFRVQLERHPRDLYVVARLEALVLERADHADPTQASLQVRQRVVVVEVVARDQALDSATGDPDAAVAEPLDAPLAFRPGP